jgi:hypothetical protein
MSVYSHYCHPLCRCFRLKNGELCVVRLLFHKNILQFSSVILLLRSVSFIFLVFCNIPFSQNNEHIFRFSNSFGAFKLFMVQGLKWSCVRCISYKYVIVM